MVCRLIERHFEQMKPLATVDPLFLQEVVYVCPKKELPALMKQIPPFMSATWLSSTIYDTRFLDTDEVRIFHELHAATNISLSYYTCTDINNAWEFFPLLNHRMWRL